MRISEEKNLSGYFWLPDEYERKIPGTLRISDGGIIELETVGNFDKEINFSSEDPQISRILGHVETEGVVTLDNCFYRQKNISLCGISKSTIHVSRLLSGVLYDKGEPFIFDSFRFSVEGLDEWLSTTGFKVDHDFKNKRVSIEYSPPEEKCVCLNDLFNLKFTFGWTVPGAPIFTEAKITQRAYIEISSNGPQTIDNFISVAHKITNFLSFAVDKTVSINSVSAKYSEIKYEVRNGEYCLLPIHIIYPSLPFADYPEKIEWYSMLFRYNQTKENIENILKHWFNAYDKIEPAMNLYFASRTGAHRFLNGKFLSLAQCLETFHRRISNEVLMPPAKYESLVSSLIDKCPERKKEWLKGRLLFGNEINMRKRLKKVIRSFQGEIGNKKACDKIINNIVDTRNYFTHYNEDLKDKAANGHELWSLCMKMEAIFQMHLLKTIGFSNEQIAQIVQENRQLKYKLKEA